ncbi:MAG TPA: hypothetical protein VLV86_11530 [Vicinamibacterales bacterium]|nr:hypothetical protein [Vicinamibacterales bacterium]
MAVALGIIALVAPSGRAQPSPSPSKPDLSGTWTIDPDVSTDLAKIDLIPSSNSARQSTGTRRGGFGGGGFGGRGFGGTRSRTDGGGAPKLTSDEQARLKAMADALKTGWTKLTISLHDPSFVVNDSRNRTWFFSTDGNAADNHVGDFTLPTTTRWDGDRLVTEWPIGTNMTLVCSYTLLANMKRLVVRVDRKDGQNTRPFEPNVYLLYRRSA